MASRHRQGSKREVARPQRTYVLPLLVMGITAFAFLPSLRNGFVPWDDSTNFVSNPNYRGLGGEQLRWMWSTFHLGHYTPITWMTLGLDYTLWGMNPAGYHLTSLVIHTVNAMLVYSVLRRLIELATPASGQSQAAWPAAFAALLFALHPLRVESVAWATERRDVLSLCFSLGSILLYLRSRNSGSAASYLLSLVAFAAALLSKATVVTLPAVLLLINVYPMRRVTSLRDPSLRRVLVELAPFALLSVAFSALSIIALHPPEQLAWSQKLAVSAYGIVFYLWKTILPIGLSPLYPMPSDIALTSAIFGGTCIATIALLVMLALGARRFPGLVACVISFLVVTFPLLGIVQNGPQITADRYTYHGAVALLLPVAVLWEVWRERHERKALIGAGVVVFVLSALTWRQTHIWRDGDALWAQALEVDDNSPIAHSAMASVLYGENRVDDGIAQSRRAVELAPSYEQGWNNLGTGLARSGDVEGALRAFGRALALKPDYDEAENNLGIMLSRKGDLTAAIRQYENAIRHNPANADAHVNLGNVLGRLNRVNEAAVHFQHALDIRPGNADAEFDWGAALANHGDLRGAIQHFRAALSIDPEHPEAKELLARAERARER